METSQTTSEKRIAANRLNAQKSSGPKTVEGKSRSKLNAVRHGLRADSIAVLPSEDAEAFEARRSAWTEELQPSGSFEGYLVDLVTANSWRLDRCRRVETTRLSSKVLGARERFDRDLADRNIKLIEELAKSPATVAPRLRETSEGTIWMIKRLGWILGALESRGHLEPTEKDQVLNILGKTPDEIYDDLTVLDISEAYLNAGWPDEKDPYQLGLLLDYDLKNPNTMRDPELFRRLEGFIAARDSLASQSDDPEYGNTARARRDLAAILQSAIDSLRDSLPSIYEKESVARDEAVNLAALDISPEGLTISRYEASQRRAFHNSVRDLMKHRESVVRELETQQKMERNSRPKDPWRNSPLFESQPYIETSKPTPAPNEPIEELEILDENPAPNEPTEETEAIEETVHAVPKEIEIPKNRAYARPIPPKDSLSEVRGYGGAIPIDPARWLADQDYYDGVIVENDPYNPIRMKPKPPNSIDTNRRYFHK